uniref:Calcineurin-like phosphoesterase domain-containing protein n=1 Tax=Oryza brachyantha TaxID=4533 RepID=J3MBV2_ORYBR
MINKFLEKIKSRRIHLTTYSAFAFLIILFWVKMESIAKAYEVKFVLDVAQLGEEDPLWQNGSLYFQALKIPWYSTTSSHGQIIGNFLKKVKMPYDQNLEIISMDTGPLQEPIHDGKISASSREQIKWLEQSIAVSSSNWKIVVGYDPLVVCTEAYTPKTAKFYEPLQHIFEKYAVSAYVSMGGFCGCFRRDNSMLYIGNPSPDDQTGPDGFLLHTVNPLEMESQLINLEGKVVERSVVHHHGLEAL